MKNYIQNFKIERLDGNDSLTHKEIISVDRNGKREEIIFYHSKTFPRSKKLNFNHFEENPPECGHANWFNQFFNKNERFFKPGATTIDIGACEGDTALAINYLSNGAKLTLLNVARDSQQIFLLIWNQINNLTLFRFPSL